MTFRGSCGHCVGARSGRPARKMTVRPFTRTSTERTRSPNDCATCFSIRPLTALSVAGSKRGSTVIELSGSEEISDDDLAPGTAPIPWSKASFGKGPTRWATTVKSRRGGTGANNRTRWPTSVCLARCCLQVLAGQARRSLVGDRLKYEGKLTARGLGPPSERHPNQDLGAEFPSVG